MMDSHNNQTIYLEARDLPAKTVIVYGDRAEVKRQIDLNLPAPGKYTVLVQNLSSMIERQSIRVEGRRLVEIGQVQYEEQPWTEKTPLHSNLQEQETEKTKKEAEKLEMEDELHVLRKRLDVLDGVAGQIGQNATLSLTPNNSTNTSSDQPQVVQSPFLLCNEAMQNLGQFLDYYAKTASDLRQQLREKEKRLSDLVSQLDMLERQIDQLRCRLEYDNHKRNLRIVVETTESGQAQVFLCYQVYCVSWRPAYDIRASTSQGASCEDFSKLDMEGEEEEKEEGDQSTQPPHITPSSNQAQIYYYGLIEQKTDENWENVELVLSTAQPCVAGTLPPLPTLTASFQRTQPSFFRQRNLSAHRRPLSNGSEEDMGIGSFDYECTDALALQRLTIARSNSDSDINQTREQIPSSCFAIEEPTTITANGQPHRVLIAQLTMEPKFTHETNPSKSTSVLLSASILNTSTLPLLHGQASIFLNNSFICQTQLKTVLPHEHFSCSLGVDPSVKIEYKPAKRTSEKIGFMSKSSLTTHEQIISVRNAKVDEKVQLTVREPIPRPIDEKIKVSILSPELRASRLDTSLTKDNHLEWICELGAGEKKDLVVKWSMEFPLNEQVVYASSIGGAPISGNAQLAGQWSSIQGSSSQYCQLMGSQQRVY